MKSLLSSLTLLFVGPLHRASCRRAVRLLPPRVFRQQQSARGVLAEQRGGYRAERDCLGRLSTARGIDRVPHAAQRHSHRMAVGARRQLGRAGSIRQFPEPIPGLCRRDALFLGLFAGTHRRRRSAQRDAVRRARGLAGGDHARQLHCRRTARGLHGRPSRRPMGAGPHSVRKTTLSVRLPVPTRAPAKRHLSPAARGRKKARADRRRHPNRRRDRGGRRCCGVAGAGWRGGEGLRPPHRCEMAGTRGKRRRVLRGVPLARRRAVRAGRHATAGRQSICRLHRPVGRHGALPGCSRRLAGAPVEIHRPQSRRQRAS